MGLSRLENFLKSARGTILYVNPNDLDATDSVENQGNSLTRPFKTIQRALIESSRFSYQKGMDNDRFGKTTIVVYPGEHLVDNRPGWIPDGASNYRLRNGTVSNDLPAFDSTSNFDLSSADNELYKLNSIYGGVIIPRGTSLVGMDLRKTKIRPKYVPNPTNDNIERSAIFRVTGGCYFWQFSVFDANPNGTCITDYTTNEVIPNFSHHKLTVFEYADGVNAVSISDEFQTYSTTRTDLDMYYEKVGLVYGQSSGRAIEPDYPSSGLDIQPKIDEYRIVGSTGESVGISSIYAGDSGTATTKITVTTTSAVDGLQVDTPFRISGVTATGYSGQFVVAEKPSSTVAVYNVQTAPDNAAPSSAGATLALTSDTVTSASPYILNISSRSVYGMCGCLADGDKATGFKSMIISQFTGIGVQKDDNAFVIYNNSTPKTGAYDDNSNATKPLSTDSKAVHKPSYRNYHIKTVNDATIQNSSSFAIGYAEHFAVGSGGDISMSNSSSNFGSKALVAKGFKRTSFSQDDTGYITHIIPPKEIPLTETSVEFELIDVNKTGSAVGVGSTGFLYLYGQSNVDTPPENVIDGYRVGARENDSVRSLISSAGITSEYTSRIVMQGKNNTQGSLVAESSSEKVFTVGRSAAGINSIGSSSAGGTANVLTLSSAHNFINGETVRVIGDTGQLPDGLVANTVYFAITSGSGISTNVNIKLGKTLDDALKDNELSINNKGGVLKVTSRVTDKNSGDIGHPIQYDSGQSQWYINVSTASTDNTIYPTIVGLGSTALGEATPRTFFKRRTDNRNPLDSLYRARYLIPKSGSTARPPSDGFILQESNTAIGATTGEIETYFGSGSLSNQNEQRNFRFIADASWDGTNATITTELPHDLTLGSEVELVNVKSSENTSATKGSGFDMTFVVAGISSAKQFSVGLSTDPGSFTSDTSDRTTALPFFKRKKYENTYYVFKSEEAQEYIAGEQDGIYYLTFLNASNSPTVSPFTEEKFSQPVKELYPQVVRDNPVSDPTAAQSFAISGQIGEVAIDDVRNSLTKETLNKYNADVTIGVGITEIQSRTGTAHTITTLIPHGLNRATVLSIVSGGAGYGSGSAGDIYNARLVGIGTSVTGRDATAKLTVDASGTITGVKIMSGGGSYGIGNTMNVVGVTTYAGFSQAVVKVDQIYDNVGDVLKITGVSSETYKAYDDLYRITGIGTTGTSITVSSASTVTGFSTTGIGGTNTTGSYLYLTGASLGIQTSTFSYTNVSGIATVITEQRHGLKADTKVRFAGFTTASEIYNGSWVVNEILTATSFSAIVGVGTTVPTATGTPFVFPEGYSSRDGVITENNENLNGRMIIAYDNLTSDLSSQTVSAVSASINITSSQNLDINIGDYLMVNDEIMRVKTTTTGAANEAFDVFRGVLGTKATAHAIRSVVRRIRVYPVELRRHSILRASGHTFEYVGFGPGNYSTAFPSVQDRDITRQEELLAQSTRQDGGMNYYTGMNDKGISYNGYKRLSALTGTEEIFDTPVRTITGEDIGNLASLNVTESSQAAFSRSIKVEGGSDNKITSEFNGPVILSNKLTSTSDKGIEANSFFIQGDQIVSRKLALAGSTPVLAGNPGDVVYYSDPTEGGYAGWVYTTANDWRRFGSVSLDKDLSIEVYDKVGIGTTNPFDLTLQVGSGTSLFAADSDGVGVGTTANGYKLNVEGGAFVSGIITASKFSGDGSELTNLNVSATGWTNYTSGVGSISYNTSQDKVGIGTTQPRFSLEVGNIGASGTSFYVNGDSHFVGFVTTNDAYVSGMLTVTDVHLPNAAGTVTVNTVGIGTTNPLQSVQVGLGNTTDVMVISGVGSVGVGTTNPSAPIDLQAHTRFRSYSEQVGILTIYSNIVTVDLSQAQSFICTATDDISGFRLYNIPSESTSFTIKMSQDGTGSRAVGIDTFYVGGGSTFPVYWPGGVVPVVTTTASRTDIYSFKIFDGTNVSSVGMYGIVGGQNFA